MKFGKFGQRPNQVLADYPANYQAPTKAKPPSSEPLETHFNSRASDAALQQKAEILALLLDTTDISHLSSLSSEAARTEIAKAVEEIVAVRGGVLTSNEQLQLIESICDDVLGYGPLEPLLKRDDISDIMVNGLHNTFIEVNGRIQQSPVRFRDNRQLLNICQRIVGQVGRRVDESSPICDARLADGSRVNIIVPPLSIDGASLTIRKFKKDKLTLDRLVEYGSISVVGAELLKIISRIRCNVIVSGGTGSGKTTLLNCLTQFIDTTERIITCEDSAELQLQQPHVVRLETRPPNIEGGGKVSMTDLVRNCLRMRPERIIVGEVRGAEVMDLLQAMNTGHDGSMGTVHSNSPRECLSRIESMIAMGGYTLPQRTLRELVVGSVDVIIQAVRLRDGSRRITHITELCRMEGDVVITQDLLRFKVDGERDDGTIIGRHVATGIKRPIFMERAKYFNEQSRLERVMDELNEASEI